VRVERGRRGPYRCLVQRLSTLLVLTLLACGGDREETPAAAEGSTTEARSGAVVAPPFSVRGNAEGLLLVWFDAEGPHTATSRLDVPAERRSEVRVESLDLDHAEGADPDAVYVADLRAADEDGDFTVRRMSRADFDARIDAFVAEARSARAASADVVVFGASWCGACRQAEAYLRERNVPFVERDIEEDPAAAAEMRARAAAAGLHPTGIPVIDVRGRILLGFDPEALDAALRETAPEAAGGVTI
jgi:glutaredoxin